MRTPQLSYPEIDAFIEEAPPVGISQWICVHVFGASTLAEKTMHLLEQYNPETELFAAADSAITEALLKITLKYPEKRERVIQLCHEKDIPLPSD